MADSTVIARSPLAHLIGDRSVSFVAQDIAGQNACVLEGSDLVTRHAPFSTFKIANLLIALETGAEVDLNTKRRWDSVRRPTAAHWPKVWQQDHTLASAFASSVVWYFRDIAQEVGTDRYKAFLKRWQYGNAQVRAGSDRFWLNEGLEISPREQVDFLARVLDGQVALRAASVTALTQAAKVDVSEGTGLFAKTGAGPDQRGGGASRFEGWYVGWVVRRGGAMTTFALHAAAQGYPALKDFRKAFAVRLLKQCGVLPDGF